MLEINKEQLLSFDYINRIRILKGIAEGTIKYKGVITNEYINNAKQKRK